MSGERGYIFSQMVEERPIDPTAMLRIVKDPYMQHMAQLIGSGLFPEARKSLQEEFFEHMGDLIAAEGLDNVV